MKRFALTLFLLSAACESDSVPPEVRDRMMAADGFTRHYAATLKPWNLRAHAAGADCSVLFVESSLLLDDSLIEEVHYGTGAYAVYEGRGVQHFCLQRSFRGVAYKDPSGHIRTFGKVSATEAQTLSHCE